MAGAPLSASGTSGLSRARSSSAAVRLDQNHLFDLFLRQVDHLAIEPAQRIGGEIERAAREPALRVAGLAQIDAIDAAAKLIDAVLAGDDLAEQITLLVARRHQRRFGALLPGVLDVEPRIEVRLAGFRLDILELRQTQQRLMHLRRIGRVAALLLDQPLVALAPQRGLALAVDQSKARDIVGPLGQFRQHRRP